jgi:hypothetical protein
MDKTKDILFSLLAGIVFSEWIYLQHISCENPELMQL